MHPPPLHADRLRVGYGNHEVLRDVSVTLPAGKLTVVVGPNGCGKSTLLKSCARLVPLRGGTVILDGRDIHRLPTKAVARKLGLLPQAPSAPDGLLVSDLVALGRHPHRSLTRPWDGDDERAVARALALTRMDGFADEEVDALSGGQRQRAWIAMALAQDTEVLLLDEPTTYLDLATCIEVLELIRDLHRDHGKTVGVVLHDLLLAARYADETVVMRDGAVVAAGRPGEVFTVDLLRDVFGLDAVLLEDPVSDRPLIVPLGRSR
ncbi:ABC transporter ATP-binding protein [Corynebacterium freneyi]|uniref:Iron complex transport system ATP-binding protein n=1 Tax=Corynebacterium freneyi TaxID=134034 RepID=A0ABS4UAK3_9CORY|nr:ABC transporter ATP-binding protein [Corynebacterium freneyi]MBP2333557.1 iron complex transport system ATP-binding protein [Corynebacterium freneyi]QXA52419.1 ABC transporter ATP-binding protein [Corynebacterium freneyi]WJZ04340.1 putative siderophore transport system ATP-binding protein YusV [Corynebacterium freneyi]